MSIYNFQLLSETARLLVAIFDRRRLISAGWMDKWACIMQVYPLWLSLELAWKQKYGSDEPILTIFLLVPASYLGHVVLLFKFQ